VKRLLVILFVIVVSGGLIACCLRPLVRQDYEFPAGHIDALAAFDVSDWAAVLKLRVNGEGRVDYEGLLADREPLRRYLALIGEVGPTTRPDLFPTDDDKLAYWINAYNAATMNQVLIRWPLKSVIDDKISFFAWTRYRVDGRSLSLYTIENDIVRKQFGDARIHFALNCAGIGCPRLPTEPFLGKRLQSQLERETRRFLNETRNVAVEDGKLVLSEIFSWYADDFTPGVVEFVLARRPDLKLAATAETTYRTYDWSLNSQE